MGTFTQDLKYGLRMLARNKSFTLVATLALALGIGANTAVFSVVNAVLLRPLPYRDPQRLVWITQEIKILNAQIVGGADYLNWHDYAKAFDGIAAFAGLDNYTLTGRGELEQVHASEITAGFLPVLGVQPALGRSIQPDEDHPNANPVAVLTYGFWRSHFAAERNVLGQAIALNGQNYTIVGVAPRNFRYPVPGKLDVMIPLALDPVQERAGGRMRIVDVIGRVKAGVTLAQAQQDLATVQRHLPTLGESPGGPAPAGPSQPPAGPPGPASPSGPGTFNQRVAPPGGLAPHPAAAGGHPGGPGGTTMMVQISPGPGGKGGPPQMQVKLIPLQQHLVGDVKPALLILLGTVAFVLLIACTNVANLLLARATARGREIGVRVALGAARGRLARQLLTESLLLSLAGGVVGLLMAYGGICLIESLIPTTISGDVFHQVDINIDPWVLGFTLLISVVAGMLFGVFPALAATRTNVGETLKESGQAVGVGMRRSRLREALVITEVALALVPLIGAGLLIRSFYRLTAVDPGFQPASVLTLTVNLPSNRYSEDAQKQTFFKELLRKIQALPGVEYAGLTDSLPLTHYSALLMGIRVEGHPAPLPGRTPRVSQIGVTPHYFRAVGIRLLRGRQFNDLDIQNGGVSIINESMARAFWGEEDPIGKRFSMPMVRDAWGTVVGVVGNVRHEGLDVQPVPEVYTPMFQGRVLGMTDVAIRARVDPSSLASVIRKQVSSLDNQLTVYNVETLQQMVSGSVSPWRFNMVLLGIFAALAMTLACVGIYGVMSYSVSQRTHEIGVRMALGAARGDVLRLVVRRGMVLVGIGMAIGLAASFALTRFLASLLFEVKSTDPITFAAVSLALAGVALAACFIPARRAADVDPIVALRYE